MGEGLKGIHPKPGPYHDEAEQVSVHEKTNRCAVLGLRRPLAHRVGGFAL